jgi:hypothetical protein
VSPLGTIGLTVPRPLPFQQLEPLRRFKVVARDAHELLGSERLVARGLDRRGS